MVQLEQERLLPSSHARTNCMAKIGVQWCLRYDNSASCDANHVLTSQRGQLNASDERKLDTVRNRIKSFAETSLLFSKAATKLVILDEADAMRSEVQFALRRIIEKYSHTTRFCLICNYVSRIIPALQSRCTKFRFSPLSDNEIKGRLEYVCSSEGLSYSPSGLNAILRLSDGDMRKVLNLLQATAMAFDNQIEEEHVYSCSAAPHPQHIHALLRRLLNDEGFETLTEYVRNEVQLRGYSLTDIITALANYVTDMALPPLSKIYLIKALADLEVRCNKGCDPSIQAATLVGAFTVARAMIKE